MDRKPTKQQLEELYMHQYISPDDIGKIFNVSGRTIRKWMSQYQIPRLGPSHLRTGKSADWNKGITRSTETKEKIRLAQAGKTPHNKDKGRIHFKCLICGVDVFDKPYRKKHTCSAECRNVFLGDIRGENHWNYRGETAAYKQRARNWAMYRHWRNEVLKNASFTCAKCNKAGGKLTAHHINSFSDHIEQRFEVDNGAALCWNCHWDFHRSWGHKTCNRSQFETWITTN